MAKKPAKPAAKPRSREIELAPSPQSGATLPLLTFSQLLGQDRAVATLRKALQSGRVHHAWIFHGPTGVGKLTAAITFAAILLDPQASAADEPKAQTDTRRRIASASHPDLHIIRKELASVSRDDRVRSGKQTQIPKAVIDEFLIEPAHKTRLLTPGGPTLASKVFIVDEAELLNAASQTILLKTIEEPPPGTVIILITSSEHELAATIRSRCQRVGFAPLAEGALARWATDRAGDEFASLDEQSRAWLLRFSGGAPGVVAAAIEGKLWTWHQRLAPMLASAASGQYVLELGPAMADLADDFAEAAVKGKPLASKDAANRAAASWMFRLVGEELRQGLRRSIPTSGGQAGAADEPLRKWAKAQDLLTHAERQLDMNVQMQFVFEALSSELAANFAR